MAWFPLTHRNCKFCLILKKNGEYCMNYFVWVMDLLFVSWRTCATACLRISESAKSQKSKHNGVTKVVLNCVQDVYFTVYSWFLRSLSFYGRFSPKLEPKTLELSIFWKVLKIVIRHVWHYSIFPSKSYWRAKIESQNSKE